jgi:hypothetical protein
MITERGAVGEMRTDRGNQRKPALLQVCIPQILYNLTSDQTQASAVGNQATNRLSYATAQQAIKDSKTLHTNRAQNKREMKMIERWVQTVTCIELYASKSCNDTGKDRMIKNE